MKSAGEDDACMCCEGFRLVWRGAMTALSAENKEDNVDAEKQEEESESESSSEDDDDNSRMRKEMPPPLLLAVEPRLRSWIELLLLLLTRPPR
jgi:hypothetical protein